MSLKALGQIMVIVGVAAALLAVLANPLGIGNSGFGWKQTLLLAVGLVLIVAGVVVTLRAPSSYGARGESETRGRWDRAG